MKDLMPLLKANNALCSYIIIQCYPFVYCNTLFDALYMHIWSEYMHCPLTPTILILPAHISNMWASFSEHTCMYNTSTKVSVAEPWFIAQYLTITRRLPAHLLRDLGQQLLISALNHHDQLRPTWYRLIGATCDNLHTVCVGHDTVHRYTFQILCPNIWWWIWTM